MTDELPAGVFEPDGSRWVPTPIATGPWDPNALHGGPPAALVGRQLLDHEPGDTSWFLSRLTVELIRPVPRAPLTVAVDLRRPGRRVQLLDAVITDPDGTEVLWARGLRLAQSDNGLDESQVPLPPSPELPPPATCAEWTFDTPVPWLAFGEAYEFRLVQGRPFWELGPALVWSRLKVPLIAGEPTHPLDRVLTLADFPNGFGNSVPFDRFAYINPDLTVSLHRLPAGEWVLLDAAMHPRSTGHGTAGGRLADEQGVLGSAVQSLLISAR
ncbi:MAG TPA: thioesterase family protein [Acidimicrobiales bacterium]|jgi:hypothetical protein|nr:thioesterase family protein [Acidimicrobiales bacterium]